SSSGRSTVSSREVRKAAKILALMRRDVAYTRKMVFRLRRYVEEHLAMPLDRPGARGWSTDPAMSSQEDIEFTYDMLSYAQELGQDVRVARLILDEMERMIDRLIAGRQTGSVVVFERGRGLLVNASSISRSN